MKQQLNIFFNALSYYSRIPTPHSVRYGEQELSQAFGYFPLVGIIVGVIGYGCWALGDALFPAPCALLMAMSAMALATGGLHEDALADLFDGFGGGRDREAILRIMKDSCVGTYGVLALIFSIALKYGALAALPTDVLLPVLVAAAAASRLFPVLLVRTSRYLRSTEGKAGHTRLGIDGLTLGIATLFGITPLLYFGWLFALVYVGLATILLIGYRRYLHLKIGGFTGDTLGALQQFAEMLFYLWAVYYI